MPYKIKSICVQGIRGFNKEEELSFGDGVTLLYGANGTGKSSLLQSIEWGITGSVPSMKGGDFTREDAIVNLFSKSKKATVGLSLSNKGTLIVLNRTRKMSTRTSSGKQPLEVTQGAKTFNDEEAEMELKNALGIDLEDFSRSKFLHQETIREVLNAKPEDRSQAIDKLIGIFEIREFSKTIDADRQIKTSLSAIEDTIESLKRDKIQFLINLKRSLQKNKDTLIKKGYSLEDLTVPSVIEKIQQSKDGIESLYEKYEAKGDEIGKIEPSIASFIDAQRLLLSELNSLDRVRLLAINKINFQKTSINAKATRYEEIYDQLKEMKDLSSEALTAQIKQIDEELTKISSSMKNIRQKLVTLPHKRNIYEANKARVTTEKSKLNDVTINYGTPEEIQQKIEKANQELATFQSNLDKLSSQQGLLTMAIESLESTKSEACPVCSQTINNTELLRALKLKVSEEIVESIKKLKESQKATKANERIFEEKFEESNRFSASIKDFERELELSAQQIRLVVPDLDSVNLDETIKGWEEEISQFSGKESELVSKKGQINDVLSRITKLMTEIKNLQSELQKATMSTHEGPDLLKRVQELSKSLDDKIACYSDSLQVDRLRKTLTDLADVLTYLRDDSQVADAEKELPMVEKQMKGLEARAQHLEGLSNSLQSIRQMTIQYEKEAAITQLKRLEDDINNYYSQIQGHPYFKRIKIDIEKEDPLIFSIRAASASEDTYIPTRFSTAQLNSVALSIFMSYNNEQAGNFPVMILDDPTQNMDQSHKEIFAKLIAELSSKNQIIIATEDNDTRKFLEQQCSGIKTYEFSDWTNEGNKIKVA